MFSYPDCILHIFSCAFVLYFVSSFIFWFTIYFKDEKALESIVGWLRIELDQLHPGYNSEIFYAQNLKYNLEKYFENSIV